MKMKRIWRQIETWLAANAPATFTALAKPATVEEIATAEKQLGCRLPRAVKDSYLIHDGSNDSSFLEYWQWLSLKEMIHAWEFLKGLQKQGVLDGDAGTDSDFIKPLWWHERWIPIFYDACGNYLCLDLVPRRGGRRGQIICYYHDEDKRYLVADGLESYLQTFADKLSANRYFVNKHGTLTLKEDDNSQAV